MSVTGITNRAIRLLTDKARIVTKQAMTALKIVKMVFTLAIFWLCVYADSGKV